MNYRLTKILNDANALLERFQYKNYRMHSKKANPDHAHALERFPRTRNFSTFTDNYKKNKIDRVLAQNANSSAKAVNHAQWRVRVSKGPQKI